MATFVSKNGHKYHTKSVSSFQVSYTLNDFTAGHTMTRDEFRSMGLTLIQPEPGTHFIRDYDEREYIYVMGNDEFVVMKHADQPHLKPFIIDTDRFAFYSVKPAEQIFYRAIFTDGNMTNPQTNKQAVVDFVAISEKAIAVLEVNVTKGTARVI